MSKKIRPRFGFLNLKTFSLLILILGGSLSAFSIYSFAGLEMDKGYQVAQNSPRSNFNHESTSFQLLGAHRGLECNKCHFGGRYKGTPRTCESCHNGQISYGKPATHLVTTQTCALCHSQNGWIPSNFTHDPSTTGQCSNCHNGQKATGKPSNHISTNSQCDTCHRTTGWIPAGFNHANLAGQLCSSCHRAGGPGMPPKNDLVHGNLAGQDCNSCHSSTTTFSTVTMNHAGIVVPCSTCHSVGNSVGAVAKPANHMATTQECNLCHAGTTTFANGVFNHSSLTGQLCSSCHKAGGSGMAPKNDVVHSNLAGQDCSSCHASTTTFTTVTMNHAGIVVPCSTCHSVENSVGAVAKPANHMVTTSECNLCHAGTTTFANGVFNHSSLTGQLCSSCHKAGGSGMAPKNDVVHSNLAGQDCSSCHASTTTFTTVTMNHAGIVVPCSTCHSVGNSVGAVAKPANHMVTTSECNLCHAGTTTFANGVFNHSSLTGQLCSSCHKAGGSGMAPKNDVVHSNLNGQDCSSCHSSTTSFTVVTMNHAGIVASCKTCHYAGNTVGAVAPRSDTLHNLSTLPDCGTCHTSTTQFSTWTMNHTGISPPQTCISCHVNPNNMGAVYKPSGHPITALDCASSGCHTTTTFSK